MKLTIIAWLLGALALSACGPTVTTTDGQQIRLPADATPLQAAEAQRLLNKAGNASVAGKDQLTAVTASPEALTEFLANSTVRSYDMFHGSQIEYLGADGTTQLWYPGNWRLLPGRWMVRQSGRRVVICFAYGPNSYNPATGAVGSDWECESARGYLLGNEEVAAGDPLKLASGKMPFVLSKGRISINEVLKRLGKPASARNKIAW